MYDPAAEYARLVEDLRVELQRQRGAHQKAVAAAHRAAEEPDLITADEFAAMMRVSRRHLDRLRKARPVGFPTEHNMATTDCPSRRAPRFWRSEVVAFINSRGV